MSGRKQFVSWGSFNSQQNSNQNTAAVDAKPSATPAPTSDPSRSINWARLLKGNLPKSSSSTLSTQNSTGPANTTNPWRKPESTPCTVDASPAAPTPAAAAPTWPQSRWTKPESNPEPRPYSPDAVPTTASNPTAASAKSTNPWGAKSTNAWKKPDPSASYSSDIARTQQHDDCNTSHAPSSTMDQESPVQRKASNSVASKPVEQEQELYVLDGEDPNLVYPEDEDDDDEPAPVYITVADPDSTDAAPLSRNPFNLSTQPTTIEEFLDEAAMYAGNDEQQSGAQLMKMMATVRQAGIDFVGSDGDAFQGLHQVPAPWLTDKGRAVLVMEADDGSTYPGLLEVVVLRDSYALQHSCDMAAQMQRLRRQQPEQLEHVPRVYRLFTRQHGSATLHGMVAELVHSSCYQLRQGRPGGVPLAVACSIALQACQLLQALHGQGLCHGNINVKAMGLKIDAQHKAELKLWDFWKAGDTIVYPAPEAAYAELSREEARNYRNRRLPVYAGWSSDISAVDWCCADMWQLGCCLWELLSGSEVPYYRMGSGGATLADCMDKELKVLLKEGAPEGGWNKHIMNVLRKLLSPSPTERATAAEAHADLMKISQAIAQGKA